jgi:hypothetical protein
MSSKRQRTLVGCTAVAFYGAHAATWLQRGAASNLLWTCHLGCLLVGAAILARRPMLNAVGVLWLFLGNIIWSIHLASGGEFIMTSQLTHLGGLLAGLWFARAEGFPRRSWLAALAGIAALHVLSGFITAPSENVNLAFRVWSGWEKTFPDFQLYRLFLLAVSAVLFFLVELAARRFLSVKGKH